MSSLLSNSFRSKRYMGGLQNGLRGVPLILAFTAIGFFGLHATRAASYVTTAEAESGSRSGSTLAGDPAGASGGAAVKFQSGNGGGVPQPACTKVVAASASLQSAISAARAGDVLCLTADATFTGDMSFRSPAGTSSSPITITSQDRTRQATIKGRLSFLDGADYITVSYLKLNGINSGGLPSPTIGADHFSLLYNDITNQQTAICVSPIDTPDYGTAHNTLIDHNRIHNCGKLPSENKDHGVYNTGIDTRITNNIIYANADRGIQLRGSQGAIVMNNIVDDNGEGVIFGDLNSSNNQVTHNIFSNANIRYNVESFWGDAGVGTGNVFKDNCVWSSRSGSYGQNQSVQPDISGVAVSGVLFTDPMYTNATARNYGLAAASPCRAYGPQ